MAHNYYSPNKIYEEEDASDVDVYADDVYFPYDDEEEEWVYEDAFVYETEPLYYEQVGYAEEVERSAIRPQWLIFPAVFVTVVLLIFLGQSITISGAGEEAAGAETAVFPDNASSIGGASSNFIAPYDEYVLTQGLHGYSYGHMAIDIAAGAGEMIKAPIMGEITELYTDQYSNPTLVIENGRYKVTFLHGNYTAVLGQKIKQGDVIGSEGNNGYTMDSAGNLCYGRSGCGYHTHLNVFDKLTGQNVNPLDLIAE